MIKISSSSPDYPKNKIMIETPIPDVQKNIVDMFSGKDKPWKKIPIKQQLSQTPVKLTVIPNQDIPGKAMGWPGYYKNPRKAAHESGLGELAIMTPGRLQSSPLVKVRPHLSEALNQCQKFLDNNPKTRHLKIVVVDAYRTLEVQSSLFNTYKNYLRGKNPEKSESELDIEAQKMVSIPPKNPGILTQCPPPHSTGCSVDIILVNKSGIDITRDDWLQTAMIDFGSDFDEMMHEDFSDARSATRYFENDKSNPEATKNRRILYNLLTQIGGLTNFYTEWWHYDLGNQFHAASAGKEEAEYGFAGGVGPNGEIIEDLSHEQKAFENYRRQVGHKVANAVRHDFGLAEVA